MGNRVRVRVSTNYVPLSQKEAIEKMPRLEKNWQDGQIPALQRNLVAEELRLYAAGKPMAHFDALHAVLAHIPPTGVVPTLLDVGASSGYYSEVLRLRGFRCRYNAVDYSENFEKLAKSLYPDIRFDIGDARNLPYGDDSFDIVFSGGCILHILEYEDAIREAARVSRNYAIFHRTPVVTGPTAYFEKLAYGMPCLEIHFSVRELFGIFDRLGLKMMAEAQITGTNHKTYLLQK